MGVTMEKKPFNVDDIFDPEVCPKVAGGEHRFVGESCEYCYIGKPEPLYRLDTKTGERVKTEFVVYFDGDKYNPTHLSVERVRDSSTGVWSTVWMSSEQLDEWCANTGLLPH